MNCDQAEPLIFAERDGALNNSQRAALAEHLAQCAGCRRLSEGFAAAIDGWRTDTQRARVPDAEIEWQKVRREIRGGAGSQSAAKPSRKLIAWSALPIGAAAALALAIALKPAGSPPIVPNPTVARVNTPEGSLEKSPTVVFTDEKTGWTFVVAADDIQSG